MPVPRKRVRKLDEHIYRSEILIFLNYEFVSGTRKSDVYKKPCLPHYFLPGYQRFHGGISKGILLISRRLISTGLM